MKLYDELYFEINVTGTRSDLKKFKSFLFSGALEDFFELDADMICYNDDFANADENQKTGFVLTTDDVGIEITSLDPERFLDELCRGAKDVELEGHLYDVEDEEYRFVSPLGEITYFDAARTEHFNDELDEQAFEEEEEE